MFHPDNNRGSGGIDIDWGDCDTFVQILATLTFKVKVPSPDPKKSWEDVEYIMEIQEWEFPNRSKCIKVRFHASADVWGPNKTIDKKIAPGGDKKPVKIHILGKKGFSETVLQSGDKGVGSAEGLVIVFEFPPDCKPMQSVTLIEASITRTYCETGHDTKTVSLSRYSPGDANASGNLVAIAFAPDPAAASPVWDGHDVSKCDVLGHFTIWVKCGDDEPEHLDFDIAYTYTFSCKKPNKLMPEPPDNPSAAFTISKGVDDDKEPDFKKTWKTVDTDRFDKALGSGAFEKFRNKK